MNNNTLLLRQIHPAFMQQDKMTSQAFRPTPKDEKLLSVDNGDKVSAVEAWARFIENPQCQSAGVMAVSYQECTSEALNVIEDGTPYPEHCSIDFNDLSNGHINAKSKKLRFFAEQRDWLFFDGNL